MKKIRILIADDVKDVAEYFKEVIELQENMVVVGVAKTGEAATEIAKETSPDVILMDVQMETHNSGIVATKQIVENNPDIKVIILTAFYDEDVITDAYVAGAVEYLVKDVQSETIVETILNVYNNKNFIGNIIIQNTKKRIIESKDIDKSFLYSLKLISLLSTTEYKIFMMLVDGCTRTEIMERFNIVKTTLRNHITEILKKLEYPNVATMIKDIKHLNLDSILKKYVK